MSLGNINRAISYEDPTTNPSSGQDGVEYIRNHQYYEKILQQNDMVFIRFEKLDTDKDENDDGSLNLPEDQVTSGNWYDMIGLIDYPEASATAQMTDVAISIIGRDLLSPFFVT